MINKPACEYTRKGHEKIGRATSVLQDAISGIHIVKAFNIGDILGLKYKKLVSALTELTLKKGTIIAWTSPLNVVLSMLPFVICFCYGGYLSFREQLTPGEIVSFGLLLTYVVRPTYALPYMIFYIRNALGAVERVVEVLEQPKERTNGGSFAPIGSVASSFALEQEEGGRRSPDDARLNDYQGLLGG